MTLLPEFDVLEASGLLTLPGKYYEKPVVVKLGKVSLIIIEHDGSAIAHWSLAAIRRTNPGTRPAIFAPFGEGSEYLAIDDVEMIRALKRVEKALEISPPKPNIFLKLVVLTVVVAVLAAAGTLMVPEILVKEATALAQKTHRAELGEILFAEHAATAGDPCSSRFGDVALERLERRLFGEFENKLRIVPGGNIEIIALPGEIISIQISLLRDKLGPEGFAGYIVREKLRGQIADPLEEFFNIAGSLNAFQFLILRQINQDSIQELAKAFIERIPAPVLAEDLRRSFASADIPLKPFIDATSADGEDNSALSRLEPIPNIRTVLSDSDWLQLQSICSRQSNR